VPPKAADFLPPDLEAELNADRERIETILKEVSEVVKSLREEHDLRLQQWQRAAVEMAMTTAARLLHERIVSGDFPIDAKVRDMVAQLGEDEPVVVRLNPLDLELLKSRMERASDEPLFTGPGAPRFIGDSTLSRGECHVEGHDSMLLSDITRELQDIREDLLRRIENARP
jgi:flagellar biosynthesis/type III secretory pathway protein FliH